MKNLIVIVGPTAIGKTSLSISLAKHFKCEIISADSRQFYKEMTIGTAVPSEKELREAQHCFIQCKSIFENYTVGNFEREAIEKIETLFGNKDYLILVGGSGLYVKAILEGLDEFPEISTEIRESITEEYNANGIEYLQKELKLLDTDMHNKLERENPQTLHNPQRMMRIVEVCKGSGMPYSSFINKKKTERMFKPIVIGLKAEREIIYRRIEQRVDAMIAEGLLDETEKLYQHKYLNALQTVGYKEIFSYLDGNISLDTAIAEIKKNTRHYAKRQLTWFRKMQDIRWFDYDIEIKNIIQHIEKQ